MFFFSSRRRHTRLQGDWSSDVCSSDLGGIRAAGSNQVLGRGGFRAGSSDRTTIAEELRVTLKDMEKMAEIGRASCRERIEYTVIDVKYNKKTNETQRRATKNRFIEY